MKRIIALIVRLAAAGMAIQAPGAHAQQTAITGAGDGPPSPDETQADQTEADRATISQAFDLIAKKQPARAMEVLAPALARVDARIAGGEAKGMVFCGPSMTEAVLYAIIPGAQKKSGIVLGREVCDALFAQSYVLVELDRKAEALAALQRLTRLAPMHGHYLVELGFAYRINGDNDKAEEAYRSAIQNAEFAEDEPAKKQVRAAGQRGLGYVLIEKGDLDGAEKAYKQSLKDDPNSAGAHSELEFIAQKRKARKSV